MDGENALMTFFAELLKQYGLYTTLLVGALAYVFRDLWKRYSPKLFGDRRLPLTEHTAFRDFDRIIEHSLVNDFKCDCPIRKAIYRDILIERMKCFRSKLYEFVKTDVNSRELYPTQHDFYLKVISIIDEANIESKRQSIANGVPEFVLETLEQHRLQMRSVLGDMLKVVCYSEYHYADNEDRLHYILGFIVAFCKNYMDMLEGLLASYNGDIKTLEYKGIACKNCKVCIHDEYVKKMKVILSK